VHGCSYSENNTEFYCKPVMLFEHLGADIPVAQSKHAQTLVSN